MLTDLVLFRHGKAVRPHEARDDFERGLTPAGIAQAASQAQRLREAGFRPDLVVVSTAFRAAQTWEAASAYFPDVPVRLTRDLYLASPSVYMDAAELSKKAKVMLIAHDPGLHELARWFTKGLKGTNPEIENLRTELTTSGIAWVSGLSFLPCLTARLLRVVVVLACEAGRKAKATCKTNQPPLNNADAPCPLYQPRPRQCSHP
jgi:phosphohistidine phosphatase